MPAPPPPRVLDAVRTRTAFIALAATRARGRSGPVAVRFVRASACPAVGDASRSDLSRSDGSRHDAGGSDACGNTVAVGYAIGRSVGSAVVRNRLRRRLRALMRDRLDAGGLVAGDVLVQLRPDAVELTFAALGEHLDRALVAAGAALRPPTESR